MAVWNEAQGVVRKMLQCLEECEQVFWGAETSSFAGSLTYIFFNLQSHWRIWRTSEWENTWNMDFCFFPPFPVSESQSFWAFLRPTGLQYCQCWRHLPFSAASLHHFVKNSKIPLEGDCVSLGLSSYSGGSLRDRSCHLSVFFWVVTFFVVGNLRQLWPCYTLLELVMSGSEASGFASATWQFHGLTNSGASGVLQICSPHVLLSRRADSSDYALDPGIVKEQRAKKRLLSNMLIGKCDWWCISIYPSIHPFIYPSICLSVYLCCLQMINYDRHKQRAKRFLVFSLWWIWICPHSAHMLRISALPRGRTWLREEPLPLPVEVFCFFIPWNWLALWFVLKWFPVKVDSQPSGRSLWHFFIFVSWLTGLFRCKTSCYRQVRQQIFDSKYLAREPSWIGKGYHFIPGTTGRWVNG